ncbi:uncharacterized protein LOC115068282 [Nannospalax galili]|uniref:uncharacterized protein LOC115068282 n=1 Tax=Nannospalax galili TaxID=1026970 RepID=UPI00111C3574|nr:uncharacterized protein LOC115068282 [Nannospalax galili]
MEPTEPLKEESEVSEDSNMEMTPSSSEPRMNMQLEPTVSFLFTLLNTPEPKDAELDSDIQERQFLDKEDWGPMRTSAEMQLLQKDCRRLQEAMGINQSGNKTLQQKLQDLPTSLYQNLERILTIPEEVTVTQEEAEDTQEEAEVTQEEGGPTTLAKFALFLGQQKRPSAQPSSLQPPTPLLATALPGSSGSQKPQSALVGPEASPPTSLSLSPSNKN